MVAHRIRLIGHIGFVGVESSANTAFSCQAAGEHHNYLVENAVCTLVISALLLQGLALPGISSLPCQEWMSSL